MRALIAVFVLLALGMVAVVVMQERPANRGSGGGAVAADLDAVIATISTGEQVDIASHVPRQGLTIVEFTADF